MSEIEDDIICENLDYEEEYDLDEDEEEALLAGNEENSDVKFMDNTLEDELNIESIEYEENAKLVLNSEQKLQDCTENETILTVHQHINDSGDAEHVQDKTDLLEEEEEEIEEDDEEADASDTNRGRDRFKSERTISLKGVAIARDIPDSLDKVKTTDIAAQPKWTKFKRGNRGNNRNHGTIRPLFANRNPGPLMFRGQMTPQPWGRNIPLDPMRPPFMPAGSSPWALKQVPHLVPPLQQQFMPPMWSQGILPDNSMQVLSQHIGPLRICPQQKRSHSPVMQVKKNRRSQKGNNAGSPNSISTPANKNSIAADSKIMNPNLKTIPTLLSTQTAPPNTVQNGEGLSSDEFEYKKKMEAQKKKREEIMARKEVRRKAAAAMQSPDLPKLPMFPKKKFTKSNQGQTNKPNNNFQLQNHGVPQYNTRPHVPPQRPFALQNLLTQRPPLLANQPTDTTIPPPNLLQQPPRHFMQGNVLIQQPTFANSKPPPVVFNRPPPPTTRSQPPLMSLLPPRTVHTAPPPVNSFPPLNEPPPAIITPTHIPPPVPQFTSPPPSFTHPPGQVSSVQSAPHFITKLLHNDKQNKPNMLFGAFDSYQNRPVPMANAHFASNEQAAAQGRTNMAHGAPQAGPIRRDIRSRLGVKPEPYKVQRESYLTPVPQQQAPVAHGAASSEGLQRIKKFKRVTRRKKNGDVILIKQLVLDEDGEATGKEIIEYVNPDLLTEAEKAVYAPKKVLNTPTKIVNVYAPSNAPTDPANRDMGRRIETLAGGDRFHSGSVAMSQNQHVGNRQQPTHKLHDEEYNCNNDFAGNASATQRRVITRRVFPSKNSS